VISPLRVKQQKFSSLDQLPEGAAEIQKGKWEGKKQEDCGLLFSLFWK
jgi:hypothetical protein